MEKALAYLILMDPENHDKLRKLFMKLNDEQSEEARKRTLHAMSRVINRVMKRAQLDGEKLIQLCVELERQEIFDRLRQEVSRN